MLKDKQFEKPELKRILEVLRHADSGYLQGFDKLQKKIEEGANEANDNLKYLNLLSVPCKKIETAEPA